MQRWRRRMATSSTDADLVDNTHAFFITCFHLRDWLQSDTSVPQSVRVDAPMLVKTDASLQICADLANGLKHLVLTQPLKVGAPVSLSSGNPPTVHDAGGASLATQQLSAISASRRGTLYSRVADSSRRRGFETLTRTVARSSVQAVALFDALYAFYQDTNAAALDSRPRRRPRLDGVRRVDQSV